MVAQGVTAWANMIARLPALAYGGGLLGSLSGLDGDIENSLKNLTTDYADER